MASVAAERHQRELRHLQGCCSAECAAAAEDLGTGAGWGGGGHGGGLCTRRPPHAAAIKTNRLIPGTPFASNKELIGKIVFIAVSHADNRIVHVEIDFNSAPSIKAAAHAQDKRRIIHLKIIANVAT